MTTHTQRKKHQILNDLNSLPEKYNGSWMTNDASKAFLISVGAGPWKEKRRYNVQKDALDWFASTYARDLGQIENTNFLKVYPFEWQNKFLRVLIKNLRKKDMYFSKYCEELKKQEDWKKALEDFFVFCGSTKQGTKVLWMFARDYLDIPAFPVDRHVKRAMEAKGLPTDAWEMTNLCLDAGVNPNILNRKLFLGKNPNWS